MTGLKATRRTSGASVCCERNGQLGVCEQHNPGASRRRNGEGCDAAERQAPGLQQPDDDDPYGDPQSSTDEPR